MLLDILMEINKYEVEIIVVNIGSFAFTSAGPINRQADLICLLDSAQQITGYIPVKPTLYWFILVF